MKLCRIHIKRPDTCVVVLDFRVHERAPLVSFEAKMATNELAVLVARSIAKQYGLRKVPQRHEWLPPVKERT